MDANRDVIRQVEHIHSFPDRVRIEEERVDRIARVRFRTAQQLPARSVSIALANAFSLSFRKTFSTDLFLGATVISNVAKLPEGLCLANSPILNSELTVVYDGSDAGRVIKNLLDILERI